MLNTAWARRGMVTSPHHLASRAGLDVLRAGGTAVEAAVAVAATLAVVYPHMTGLGGDGFWLIAEPGEQPVAIDASGGAARTATAELYLGQGHAAIPIRGPLAANTVAGTVSGWSAALALAARWQSAMPLEQVLAEAIRYAEEGFCVTASQAELTAAKRAELVAAPGFAETFLVDGRAPAEGETMRLAAFGATLRRLAVDGLDSFYRGALAEDIAADLAQVRAPVTLADLRDHRARTQAPLQADIAGARLFNTPPPTQGVASLLILALFDRLGVTQADGFDHVHGLVEATKQAFMLRDREVGDPDAMTTPAQALLAPEVVERLAGRIDPAAALPWPAPAQAGDTVWLGVIDGEGRAVSMIQSLYFEFGSGVVLPRTGLVWQNRGSSFSLDAGPAVRRLRPGAKPFHTLNPALARFDDGRTMVYGTMGGEGQPQTQAAVFTRYARFGSRLQEAVTAPRWLLGRTWGEQSTTLKLEGRWPAELGEALAKAGHEVEWLPPFTSAMGHAGAIVRHPDGRLEGATDPRSDGAVAGW